MTDAHPEVLGGKLMKKKCGCSECGGDGFVLIETDHSPFLDAVTCPTCGGSGDADSWQEYLNERFDRMCP